MAAAKKRKKAIKPKEKLTVKHAKVLGQRVPEGSSSQGSVLLPGALTTEQIIPGGIPGGIDMTVGFDPSGMFSASTGLAATGSQSLGELTDEDYVNTIGALLDRINATADEISDNLSNSIRAIEDKG